MVSLVKTLCIYSLLYQPHHKLLMNFLNTATLTGSEWTSNKFYIKKKLVIKIILLFEQAVFLRFGYYRNDHKKF